MSAHRSPQRGPAIALAQLLQENPDLPGLMWTIHPDGYLSGALSAQTDVRPVLAAYQRALGGRVGEVRYVREGTSDEHFAAFLNVTWRDVSFGLSAGCPASALVSAQVAQVAA